MLKRIAKNVANQDHMSVEDLTGPVALYFGYQTYMQLPSYQRESMDVAM